MLHLVEKLENISSSKKINFNVKQIQEDFLKMIEAGASRIGTSNGVQIMEELNG